MEFPTCSLSGNKSFRDNLANNWRLSISSVESLVCVSNDGGVCYSCWHAANVEALSTHLQVVTPPDYRHVTHTRWD